MEQYVTNSMSQFLNGNQHVYVEGPIVPPLAKFVVIEGNRCKISHKSQGNFRFRCNLMGHKTNQHSLCKAFTENLRMVYYSRAIIISLATISNVNCGMKTTYFTLLNNFTSFQCVILLLST